MRDAIDCRRHRCDTRLPPRTAHHRNNLVRQPGSTTRSDGLTPPRRGQRGQRSGDHCNPNLSWTTSGNYCPRKWYVARSLVTFPCPSPVTWKCLLETCIAREYDVAPTGRGARSGSSHEFESQYQSYGRGKLSGAFVAGGQHIP